MFEKIVLEAKRAESCFIVDKDQEVDGQQRSRLTAFRAGASALVAAHEGLSPSVRRRIREGVEQRAIAVELPSCEREYGIEAEGIAARQPGWIILEGRRFPGPTRARPEPPHGKALSGEIHEDEDLTFHDRYPMTWPAACGCGGAGALLRGLTRSDRSRRPPSLPVDPPFRGRRGPRRRCPSTRRCHPFRPGLVYCGL